MEKQEFESTIRRYCLFQVGVTSTCALVAAAVQISWFPHLRLLPQMYYYLTGFFFLTGIPYCILHIRKQDDKSGKIARLHTIYPLCRLCLCATMLLLVVLRWPTYSILFSCLLAGCYLLQIIFEKLYYKRMYP